MKQVLVLIPCTDEVKARLRRNFSGSCEFSFPVLSRESEEYRAALKKADIVIGEIRNCDFEHCENLELLQSSSSGVNYYVDGGKFPEKATLCCMTGCYGSVIAEHMLGMVLSLCRRLPEHRDQQREHIWKIVKYDKRLEESTLLILGAGDIGTTLAKWMRPMVGKIIGIRRTKRDFPSCFDEMATFEGLDEKLPEADIIVAVLPHTAETAGLLDERRLRLMKDDAILVNGGRGSLIDQEALLRVMAEGKFHGVGLDVTSPEPLPKESPLWDQERLIITSHSAGNASSPEGPLDKRMWEFIEKNLGLWLSGKSPENKIDFSLGYKNNI